MARKKNTKKAPSRRRSGKAAKWSNEDVARALLGAVVGSVGSGVLASRLTPEAGSADANKPEAYPWGLRNPGLYAALAAGWYATRAKDKGARIMALGAAAGAAGYGVTQEAARMAYDREVAAGKTPSPADYSLASAYGDTAAPSSTSDAHSAAQRLRSASAIMRHRLDGLAAGSPEAVLDRMNGLALGGPEAVLDRMNGLAAGSPDAVLDKLDRSGPRDADGLVY